MTIHYHSHVCYVREQVSRRLGQLLIGVTSQMCVTPHFMKIINEELGTDYPGGKRP